MERCEKAVYYGGDYTPELGPSLTREDLEEYSRTYSLEVNHQKQPSYAQSEGYHSYVSSTDSTATPFLDRLRRDSEATQYATQVITESRGRDSIVTSASSSASSSETLKWHGSTSDISVSGSTTCDTLRNRKFISQGDLSLTSEQDGFDLGKFRNSQPNLEESSNFEYHRISTTQVEIFRENSFSKNRKEQLIAHSARVQTPKRHLSESVLYMAQNQNLNQNSSLEQQSLTNLDHNQLKLFPVNTYTVQPDEVQRIPNQQPSVLERVSELEKNQGPNKKYTFLDPDKKTKISDPALKAIQKKALLSFYERHLSKNEKGPHNEQQQQQQPGSQNVGVKGPQINLRPKNLGPIQKVALPQSNAGIPFLKSVNSPSRRASCASDYASSLRARPIILNQESKTTDNLSFSEYSSRKSQEISHFHSNSTGSNFNEKFVNRTMQISQVNHFASEENVQKNSSKSRRNSVESFGFGNGNGNENYVNQNHHETSSSRSRESTASYESRHSFHESGSRIIDSRVSRGHESEIRRHELSTRGHESSAGIHELSSRIHESGSRGHELGARTHESSPRAHEAGTRDHEFETRKHELGSRIHESNSKGHESGARSHESGARTHELGSRIHESSSGIHEAGSRNHELGARIIDSRGVCYESGRFSHESEIRKHESNSKIHESGARGHESGARGHESGARGHESGARGHESGARGHESGARGHESGTRGHESGARGHESGARGHESGARGHESGARGHESGARGHESGARGHECNASYESRRSSHELDAMRHESESEISIYESGFRESNSISHESGQPKSYQSGASCDTRRFSNESGARIHETESRRYESNSKIHESGVLYETRRHEIGFVPNESNLIHKECHESDYELYESNSHEATPRVTSRNPRDHESNYYSHESSSPKSPESILNFHESQFVSHEADVVQNQKSMSHHEATRFIPSRLSTVRELSSSQESSAYVPISHGPPTQNPQPSSQTNQEFIGSESPKEYASNLRKFQNYGSNTPQILGPAISLDDWVPERPPKNPNLRTVYPDLFKNSSNLAPENRTNEGLHKSNEVSQKSNEVHMRSNEGLQKSNEVHLHPNEVNLKSNGSLQKSNEVYMRSSEVPHLRSNEVHLKSSRPSHLDRAILCASPPELPPPSPPMVTENEVFNTEPLPPPPVEVYENSNSPLQSSEVVENFTSLSENSSKIEQKYENNSKSKIEKTCQNQEIKIHNKSTRISPNLSEPGAPDHNLKEPTNPKIQPKSNSDANQNQNQNGPPRTKSQRSPTKNAEFEQKLKNLRERIQEQNLNSTLTQNQIAQPQVRASMRAPRTNAPHLRSNEIQLRSNEVHLRPNEGLQRSTSLNEENKTSEVQLKSNEVYMRSNESLIRSTNEGGLQKSNVPNHEIRPKEAYLRSNEVHQRSNENLLKSTPQNSSRPRSQEFSSTSKSPLSEFKVQKSQLSEYPRPNPQLSEFTRSKEVSIRSSQMRIYKAPMPLPGEVVKNHGHQILDENQPPPLHPRAQRINQSMRARIPMEQNRRISGKNENM